MADEAPPNTDTTTQTAAATQSPSATSSGFSQADIDAAAQRAHNAAWAEARRKYEAPKTPSGGQPPATKQDTVTTQQPQAVDVRAEVARIRSFERAAGGFGLSPAALELLEQDFNTANPQDPAAWVTQRATAFGWKQAGSATPATATSATETPAPKITPHGPPVTGSGAPANSTTVVTDDTPILRMSEADRIALRKRIGDGPYVDRMRKEFRQGNVRVKFGR